MTPVLLVTIKISVATLILAIGLGATVRDLLYLWHRPKLLLRALLAMYVLVPAAAFLLVAVWPLPQGVKAALLVLAVSAGAPLLPRKLGKLAGSTFTVSLVVVTSLVAIIVVPIWIAALARHFDVTMDLPPMTVAWMIVKSFLLPLALGMALGAMVPKLSGQFASKLAAVAGLALTVASLTLLAIHWDVFLEVRWDGSVALIVLLIVALTIGHILGGPDPDDRTALAIACATRHIGIAVVVAAMFPGPRTIVVLAVYVVASVLVSLPYLRWRRHSKQA